MLEILLVVIIVLLIIDIYLSIKPKDVNVNRLNEDINKRFDNMEKLFREEFYNNREESRRNEYDNRQEIKLTIDSMTSSISRHIMNLSTLQQNQFETNSKNIEKTLQRFDSNLSKNISELTSLQKEKFTELTKSTEENLEKMRVTVDEKLQNTLEKRLGESFKMVNDRLEQVYKGLGEIQFRRNTIRKNIRTVFDY